MYWFRLGFLLFTATMASGYRFRCYMFCTDQTAIQHDYIEQRDRCREYAELRLDMSLRSVRGPADAKTKKTQLVNLFNECMANNGWSIVPPAADAKAPSTGAGAPKPPEAVVEGYQKKAALTRNSECMFARHAAGHSSIAAARAQACDLECAQRLKAAPDAPRPAACPSETNPNSVLTRGGDKGEAGGEL